MAGSPPKAKYAGKDEQPDATENDTVESTVAGAVESAATDDAKAGSSQQAADADNTNGARSKARAARAARAAKQSNSPSPSAVATNTLDSSPNAGLGASAGVDAELRQLVR